MDTDMKLEQKLSVSLDELIKQQQQKQQQQKRRKSQAPKSVVCCCFERLATNSAC
jgi:hypothetical protein